MLFRSWLLTSNVRYTTGTAQARARISIGAAAANMGKDRYASFCHIEKCGVRPGWCSNADTGGLRERSAPAPTPTPPSDRDDPRVAGDPRHPPSGLRAGGAPRREHRKRTSQHSGSHTATPLLSLVRSITDKHPNDTPSSLHTPS